jgi:alpha-L-rhamnosidase
MDFLHKYNPDFIRKNMLNLNYGDWLSLPPDTPQSEPSIIKTLLATAYWEYDAQLISEMAAVSGRIEESEKYEKLASDIKNAFIKEFIEPDGHIKGGTQTCYVLALYMNLVPDSLRAKAAEFLVEDIKSNNWHLSTGFNGTRYLLPILSETGYDDVAWRLLLTDTYPSWGYSIKQGATTIWERWDGWTEEKGFQSPGMNSFNHYSFGAVAEWMYRNIAGIQPDNKKPGFSAITIRPLPGGGLTYAKGVYNSINGLISSSWKIQGSIFTLEVTVPPNVEASIYVPCDEGAQITEGGRSVSKSYGVVEKGREKGYTILSAGSGYYSFKSQLTAK